MSWVSVLWIPAWPASWRWVVLFFSLLFPSRHYLDWLLFLLYWRLQLSSLELLPPSCSPWPHRKSVLWSFRVTLIPTLTPSSSSELIPPKNRALAAQRGVLAIRDFSFLLPYSLDPYFSSLLNRMEGIYLCPSTSVLALNLHRCLRATWLDEWIRYFSCWSLCQDRLRTPIPAWKEHFLTTLPAFLPRLCPGFLRGLVLSRPEGKRAEREWLEGLFSEQFPCLGTKGCEVAGGSHDQ